MASRRVRSWLRFTTDWLATEALRQADKAIPSRTLRQQQSIRRASASRLRLHIPHYWAIYVHDGRGPVNMPPGRVMIWYKDPSKDPRIRGGYPIRRREVRHLTKAEVRRAAAAGELIFARNVRGTRGTEFYSNEGNMRPFLSKARRELPRRFSALIREELRDLGVPRTLRL